MGQPLFFGFGFRKSRPLEQRAIPEKLGDPSISCWDISNKTKSSNLRWPFREIQGIIKVIRIGNNDCLYRIVAKVWISSVRTGGNTWNKSLHDAPGGRVLQSHFCWSLLPCFDPIIQRNVKCKTASYCSSMIWTKQRLWDLVIFYVHQLTPTCWQLLSRLCSDSCDWIYIRIKRDAWSLVLKMFKIRQKKLCSGVLNSEADNPQTTSWLMTAEHKYVTLNTMNRVFTFSLQLHWNVSCHNVFLTTLIHFGEIHSANTRKGSMTSHLWNNLITRYVTAHLLLLFDTTANLPPQAGWLVIRFESRLSVPAGLK